MKYYVFDEFDCFGDHETLEAAAEQAAWLIACEMRGVYIKQLSQEEFEAYCKNG